MSTHDDQPGPLQEAITYEQDALLRAREWLVFLESSELTHSDRQRFEHWMALDERNQSAFQQIESIWQAAATLDTIQSIEPPIQQKSGRLGLVGRMSDWFSSLAAKPRWSAAVVAGVIALVLVITQSFQYTMESQHDSQHYQTQIAQIQTISLDDGTVISLGPKSTIDVSLGEQIRHVKLSGEAFFDVAKIPDRPFIVETHYTQVEVLGTQFNINSNALGVTVAVASGKVQVVGLDIPGRGEAKVKLTGGQQVSVSQAQGMGSVENVVAENAAAWRRDVRIYHSQPLEHVLRDLGRYYSADLVVADKRLNQLPVTAVFPTGNVEQMLIALESVLPIQVIQINEQRIEIRANQ
jgi:transmembrane sensor